MYMDVAIAYNIRASHKILKLHNVREQPESNAGAQQISTDISLR